MTPLPVAEAPDPAWDACRFLTASVLPVRVACNLRCPFCFSKSSISALAREQSLRGRDVMGYYRDAKARGATRLVITGGGEPLLRPDDVVWLAALGREVFDEIACFTNGTYLTRALALRLRDAGLSYLCWSRHAASDTDNEALMGPGAPSLDAFFEAAGPLKVRATCVMAQGHVDGPEAVWRYVAALRPYGVRELTFKHTYVAYETSVFQGSREDVWARAHQVETDPFEGTGDIVGRLPWGPVIRRIEDVQLCYYREPTPAWELANRTGRSTNLLSDGSVYASLEDRRSLLYRLPRC
jgi:Radical SAM superfamily/4Fe-4S single cluster domain